MKKPAGHWFSYLFAFILIFGFVGTQPVMAGGNHHNKSHKKIAQLKHKIQQKFKDLHKHYEDDDDDGHKHKKKRRHPRIDRANQAGEIQGQFLRCGGDSSGIFVYIVGRSFSALLTPSGDFTLSYVPKGTYSLAFVKDNHVLTTVDGIQVRKNKLTQLGDLAFCPDNDNDGFDESVDCNDNNPNINPDATETCDGEDNNCDGEVDEGCPECTDGDNDGFFAQNGCGTAVDCDDHDPTINPNSLEVCDGRDNNCDGQTDEGCPLNCPTGMADCNDDRVDCETDLTSDPNHCGACNNPCGSGQTCDNGTCVGGNACTDQERGQLEACFAGCGGDLNCPTTCLAQVSPTCGQAVQLLGLCSVNSGCPINSASDLLSLCVSQSCSTQWEDAFGDFVPGCPLGQTQCGGQCVDLTSDDANCGSCGRACGSNQVCSSGICQVQCAPGQSNCNGQCVDLNSDPNHCGGCNVACPGSAPECSNGVCTTAPTPVDCQVSAWSAWSACSATCGGGTQTRTRTVIVPAQFGGAACPNLTETRTCNTQSCQTDADSDGYFDLASGGNDCNDFNPNINPGAVEVCDSIDNNCDGQVDEGCITSACGPNDTNLAHACLNDCGTTTTQSCLACSSFVDAQECQDAVDDLVDCGFGLWNCNDDPRGFAACAEQNCPVEWHAAFGE